MSFVSSTKWKNKKSKQPRMTVASLFGYFSSVFKRIFGFSGSSKIPFSSRMKTKSWTNKNSMMIVTNKDTRTIGHASRNAISFAVNDRIVQEYIFFFGDRRAESKSIRWNLPERMKWNPFGCVYQSIIYILFRKSMIWDEMHVTRWALYRRPQGNDFTSRRYPSLPLLDSILISFGRSFARILPPPVARHQSHHRFVLQ